MLKIKKMASGTDRGTRRAQLEREVWHETPHTVGQKYGGSTSRASLCTFRKDCKSFSTRCTHILWSEQSFPQTPHRFAGARVWSAFNASLSHSLFEFGYGWSISVFGRVSCGTRATRINFNLTRLQSKNGVPLQARPWARHPTACSVDSRWHRKEW